MGEMSQPTYKNYSVTWADVDLRRASAGYQHMKTDDVDYYK